MSVIKLFSDNPKDGTTTFNQVRFYQADDSSGTNSALIATVAIDTSNLNPIDPGFTYYIYTSGNTSKFYASTWYQSASAVETDKSTWIQGGQDRWDQMFMDEMQDTTSSVWTSTDRGYFKTKALEALYPDLFYESIDTSLTIVNNSTTQTYTYALPFGMFYVSEVGIGSIDSQSTVKFSLVQPNNWKVEQNRLVFGSLASMGDGYTIRLVGSKKYTEVGQVPVRFDPVVMYHLRMSAYLKMADDFPRFLTWARLQKGTKVQFENIRLHAREYERIFNNELSKVKDLMQAVRI